MVKKREVFKRIIHEPALSRLKRNECPACGKPKDKWNRRKDWTCCSTKCTEKYLEMYITYNWSDMRIKILNRDKNICIHCKKEFPSYNLRADHIKPIALGGDEWDINNIQTLCIDCDKIKTKKDYEDIAQLRSVEKKLVDGQTTIQKEAKRK